VRERDAGALEYRPLRENAALATAAFLANPRITAEHAPVDALDGGGDAVVQAGQIAFDCIRIRLRARRGGAGASHECRP
jgi:hypothetical protein